MVRRVFMWLAVTALAALGAVDAISSLTVWQADGGGWSFYTAGSQPNGILEGINVACARAMQYLLPLAAFNSAVYIYLLECFVRSGGSSRGFEVQPGSKSAGT